MLTNDKQPYPLSAHTAIISAVSSLATNVTVLAANPDRVGVVIVNTDANALFLKYGATATTTTSFTYYIPGNYGTWEMPQPIYLGILDGIWLADGSGSAIVTELS